jgi:hypothetical protein
LPTVARYPDGTGRASIRRTMLPNRRRVRWLASAKTTASATVESARLASAAAVEAARQANLQNIQAAGATNAAFYEPSKTYTMLTQQKAVLQNEVATGLDYETQFPLTPEELRAKETEIQTVQRKLGVIQSAVQSNITGGITTFIDAIGSAFRKYAPAKPGPDLLAKPGPAPLNTLR